jgi:tRNA pseudouridine38/39 synthase
MDNPLFIGTESDGKSTDKRAQDDRTDEYSSLSRSQLIDQIQHLKSQLGQTQQHIIKNGKEEDTNLIQIQKKAKEKMKKKKKKKKELDFDRHPKRKIALMISYQGELHGGLAWQPEVTQLSTVEGELFRALLVARLVEGAEAGEMEGEVEEEEEEERWRGLVDLNKWGYSRAGRTDAGVSGAGQVVSLWVRSQVRSVPAPFGFLPPKKTNSCPEHGAEEQPTADAGEGESAPPKEEEELQYHTIINSILPKSVRVLAWSPVRHDFDARFSCQARHYKYFFSLYESPQAPGLDIGAMKRAAHRLIGEHDFRNFCKIDPSKQLTHFRRKILSAEINPVLNHHQQQLSGPSELEKDLQLKLYPDALSPETNPLFVLDLVGTAFLYNMVRHIVSILFLIGSGKEEITVIDRLFYTDPHQPPSPSIIPTAAAAEEGCLSGLEKVEPIDCKPEYSHASALPLLLYKCVYPEASFQWISTPVGSARPAAAEPFVHWTGARIRAQLALHLLHTPSPPPPPPSSSTSSHRVFQPLGAALGRASSAYIPLLLRPRNPHFSLVNAHWWNKVGARRIAKPHRV